MLRSPAEFLGGRRATMSGLARGDQPVIEHSQLSIEVKSRRELPIWIVSALDQANAAKREGQLPVAILHQHGAP